MAKKKIKTTIINPLHKKFVGFIDSTEKSDIFITTLAEFRPLFRGLSKFGKLIGYIFNSSWNRKPNFTKPMIRKEKLGWVFRVGAGVTRVGMVPVSLLTSAIFKILNFLLKDLGHRLHIICVEYETPMWSIKEVRDTIKIEFLKITHGLPGKQSKTSDEDKIKYQDILKKITKFVDTKIVEFKSNGVRSISDMKISIRDICDNIPEFDMNLNYHKMSIEATRESIWTHIAEILYINNLVNKWLDCQKAFLSFWAYCFEKDGASENYLNKILKNSSLEKVLELDGVWNGKEDIVLCKTVISKNNTDLANGAIVIPRFILSLDMKDIEFDDMGSHVYIRTTEELYEIYKVLYDKKITYDEAIDEIDVYKAIIQQPAWKKFVKEKEKLVDNYKGTRDDIKNLVHSNILSESYGSGCILACVKLIKETCDDRHSPASIASVVNDFVDNMIETLKTICDDGTYFQANDDITDRFEMTILSVYNDMIATTSNTNLSKKQLRKLWKNEVESYFGSKAMGEFDIINPTIESYKNPKIKTISYGKAVDAPKESGYDLGQKKQTAGYNQTNTFLQVVGHNRGSGGDHIISNIDYAIWFAEDNKKRVDANEDYLIKAKKFKVLSDADEMLEIFKKK